MVKKGPKIDTGVSAIERSKLAKTKIQKRRSCLKTNCLQVIDVLAGNQRWSRTSGGRMRLAHAIMHVLNNKVGHL